MKTWAKDRSARPWSFLFTSTNICPAGPQSNFPLCMHTAVSLVRLSLLSPCPHFQLQPTYFFLLCWSARSGYMIKTRTCLLPSPWDRRPGRLAVLSTLPVILIRASWSGAVCATVAPHIALYQPQPPDWSGTAKSIHLSLWWQHARRKDSAHPTLVQTPAIHFFTLWRIIVGFVGCFF